jgi:5-methylcytosine-specific restriction endonuclease McrA
MKPTSKTYHSSRYISYKTCRWCGLTKELSEFYDGRWGKKCKVCVRSRAKQYRREHSEQYAEYDKARANLPHRVEARRKYQEEHKEEISEYKKSWTAENEESVSASRRKHYELHRDEIIARSKKWGEDNPEKVRQAQANNCRKRRAAKHASRASFTAEEFKALCERYGNKCLACGDTEAVLEADHVVPLTRGGSNDIGNIQPLCGTCNRKKFVSIIDYRSGWFAGETDPAGAASYQLSAPPFWLMAEASRPWYHRTRAVPSGAPRGRCGRP